MENQDNKSDAPIRNSNNYQKHSEWIADNVKGVDQNIEEMLLLLEQDGDISLEKADIDHLKQQELVARIKEISQRHHLLAEHCANLTGDLHGHIQSASQQIASVANSGKKLGMHNVKDQVVSSDIYLSSGGGISDASFNEDSGSSSSFSESDSESSNGSNTERSSALSSTKMLKHKNVNPESDALKVGEVFDQTEQENATGTIKDGETQNYDEQLRLIHNYAEELKVSNQKLNSAEEEITKLKSELQKSDELIAKMGRAEDQLLSAENQINLLEAHIEMENKKSLSLQSQIVELETKLELEKRQVMKLQESVLKFTAELSDRDLQIQKLAAELQDASGNFALEKWQLESCIAKLSECLTSQEARTFELQMECELLSDKIKECEAEKIEMGRKLEALEISSQDAINSLNTELQKKNAFVDNLNENLDGLKVKYDMLKAEKDGANAKLQTAYSKISALDNQIQFLEYNMSDLHSENKRLGAESDNANKRAAQLQSIIDDLETEVERQRTMISVRAEEKREAIRQLCISVDHFKSAYEELRKAYVMNKGPRARAIIA